MDSNKNIKFKAKVSYELKFRYTPFVFSGILIIVWIISLFNLLYIGKPPLNTVGVIGGISILIELVLILILSNYRTIKLINLNEKLVLQIIELGKILYEEEIENIQYWWSYNLANKEILEHVPLEAGCSIQDEVPGYVTAKNNLGATSRPLPRTLYLGIKFRSDQNIILYESLYYVDEIPKNWIYNNSIQENLIEGFRLSELVEIVELLNDN